MSSTLKRFDAGSRTVEGNVSGSRAAALERKREEEAEAFEAQKRQKACTASVSLSRFRTATKASAAEQAFSNQIVGLVTVEDFVAASAVKQTNANALQQLVADSSGTNAASANPDDNQTETVKELEKRKKAERKAQKKKLKEKKKRFATLSFGAEEGDEEEDEAPSTVKKASKKDPTVDTSFLPDKQRDEELVQERMKLEHEWLEKQERIRHEKLEITYSYWDGSGHRRSIICQKGDSIGDFLQQVLEKQLSKDFRNLQGLSSDDLMYIKEDLIIPNDLTFYDLIATKARGKSGPLFYFDIRDDVRVEMDVRVEKEESHPGKVVERKWYERSKHIFPASRWEVYDPTKDSYGTYKIGGK